MGKVTGLVFKDESSVAPQETLTELKAKADNLGIAYKGNVSKAKLAEAICKAESESTVADTAEVADNEPAKEDDEHFEPEEDA